MELRKGQGDLKIFPVERPQGGGKEDGSSSQDKRMSSSGWEQQRSFPRSYGASETTVVTV